MPFDFDAAEKELGGGGSGPQLSKTPSDLRKDAAYARARGEPALAAYLEYQARILSGGQKQVIPYAPGVDEETALLQMLEAERVQKMKEAEAKRAAETEAKKSAIANRAAEAEAQRAAESAMEDAERVRVRTAADEAKAAGRLDEYRTIVEKSRFYDPVEKARELEWVRQQKAAVPK